MEQNNYPCLLGQVLVNLISLETILRLYLLKKENKEKEFIDPDTLNIGDKIPVNSFTNYDQLEKLIQLYNEKQKNPSEKLKKELIVKFRHLFAHGRALSKEPISEFPITFIKFSNDNRGTDFVEVTDKQFVDEKYLKDITRITKEAILSVSKFLQ